MTHETTQPPRADLMGAGRYLAHAVHHLRDWHHSTGSARLRAGHAALDAMGATLAAVDAARNALIVEMRAYDADQRAQLADLIEEWQAERARPSGSWNGFFVDRDDPEVDTTPDPTNVETWAVNGRTRNGNGEGSAW